MELLEKTFPTILDTKNALIRCKNIVIQGSKKDRITYFKISVTVKLRTEQPAKKMEFCVNMKLGITCNKISCYIRDSACRWLIVETVKIFQSYVKNF